MSELDPKYLRMLCEVDYQKWEFMIRELEYAKIPEEEKESRKAIYEAEQRKAEFHYGLLGSKN